MLDTEKSSNDSKLKKSDDVADLIDISQHVNESVDSPRQSRLQKPRPRALASTSKGTLRDVTPPPQPRIISDPHFVNSDKLAKKQKRSHDENSQLICVCCLGKTKNRPRKWSNYDSLSASLAALSF